MGPGGTLYAGNDDFRMYAINPQIGKQVWALKGTDQIWSAAAFAPDGTITAKGSSLGGISVTHDLYPVGRFKL